MKNKIIIWLIRCIPGRIVEYKWNREIGAYLIAIALAASLMVSCLAIVCSTSGDPEEKSISRVSYTVHTPISINGNADFAAQAIVESWPGDGSLGNPYIIQGYDINASSADGINIQNTNVHFIVSGCYIHHGSFSLWYTGLSLHNCSNGTLTGNNCSKNEYNIWLESSSNNTLINNNCSKGYYGIYLGPSSNSNTISNNNCSVNYNIGIVLGSSSNNTIASNTCNFNTIQGIRLSSSSNNTVSNNNCSSNNCGIYLRSSTNNTISNNNCSSNNYGIYLYDHSTNNTLSDNNFSSNTNYGVCISQLSNGNTVSNNNCSNNDQGIQLDSGSFYNTLSNNNCSSNSYGICLVSSSYYNTLNNNTCNSNSISGIILLSFSNSNIISWNQACNNINYGVNIQSGSNNRIWNNTLINNNGAGSVYNPSNIQAYDAGTNNRWNSSGTLHGYGNWWSDLTAPDMNLDGIVDWSYNLTGSAGAKDYCPRTIILNDTWAPTTSSGLTGTVGNNSWYKSDVTVTLIAYDPGSGVNYTNYQINSGGWLNYTGALLVSGQGSYTIEFYSVDNASNVEATNSISFDIDTVAPTTAHGSVDYTITLTPTDATSDVDYTMYRINGGSWLTYAGTFSAGSSGMIVIDYYSVDNAGNTEMLSTFSVTNDKTAPATTARLAGTAKLNGWYVSNVTVTLLATDNVGGCGVEVTNYKIDGGGWQTYTLPFIIATEGAHIVEFNSTDLAGNIESNKNITFKTDKTKPTLTINQTTGFEVTANYTIISWLGSDATSGMQRFEISINGGPFSSVYLEMSHNFSGLTDGIYNVTVKAVDKAGNTVEQTIQFTVDTGAGGGGGIDLFNLILVVLIIGVIAGIAIPAIFGMRRKAKTEPPKGQPADNSKIDVGKWYETGKKKKAEPSPPKPGDNTKINVSGSDDVKPKKTEPPQQKPADSSKFGVGESDEAGKTKKVEPSSPKPADNTKINVSGSDGGPKKPDIPPPKPADNTTVDVSGPAETRQKKPPKSP